MVTSGRLLDKALHAVGGKDEFDRKFRQYGESVSFIDKNAEQLLKQFDESWLAVYNSKIVAHDKKYENIEKEIIQKGLPLDEVVIKYLTNRKMLTLF
ncbi:hypothetical protein ES705_10565 [subsurface metagenome]|jgi:hypothetical protein